MCPPGTDKTAMDFRRRLPEIRWQSCLSPGPGTGSLVSFFDPGQSTGVPSMSLELKPKKWAGALRTVTLGAGSRRPLTVGGGNGLPLHTFEAAFPHRPLLALEITDADPVRWGESVRQPWEGGLGGPAEAAPRAIEEFAADLLLVPLIGARPDRGNRPADQAAADVGTVLEAVPVPLIVKGPGA